jgi:uncharacterized protein YcbK (DUF882 family)
VRALALVVALAATAHAQTKFDREPKPVRPPRALPTPGAKPRALVNFYNQWTHEWLAIDPQELPPQAALDVFLRDHYTNKHARMDPRLVQVALAAAAHFQRDRVDVVSGFRHPKYNLILRKKGHQVARDSQHSHGNAMDFFLGGVPTLDLHAWVKSRKSGGVGLYMESAFVHVDTGPIRYWSGD